MNDKRYGEEVGAVIVWRRDIDATNAMRVLKCTLLVGHTALGAYETPKYLTAARAEQLPMTSTGKVQRIVLKKTFADKMSSLYDLLQSGTFRFTVIPPQSSLAEKSLALYNHCWQPLTKKPEEYKKYLGEYLTLGAIDGNGVLAGQISFSYTDKNITCVSICSTAFTPKPTPEVTDIPDPEAVRHYLLAGNDPVMNFHQNLGAELIEVTPNGRPEDKSSLGYTMRLHYPSAKVIEFGGPVSAQLIQAVRILALDVGADVYAISRPGGLAAYLNRTS